MQTSRTAAANGLVRRRWAGVLLCLLFGFGAILHVGHATPAPAHAASEIVALGNGSAPCELGHAAGEPCQPTSGCPLCAPIPTGVAISGRARAHPPMAAGALVPGRVVNPHFHPPRLSLRA